MVELLQLARGGRVHSLVQAAEDLAQAFDLTGEEVRTIYESGDKPFLLQDPRLDISVLQHGAPPLRDEEIDLGVD